MPRKLSHGDHDTNDTNIQPRYKMHLGIGEMCHADNEKRETINHSRNKVKLATEGDRRLLFQKLLHGGVGEGATPSPGLLLFTLDT